MIWLVMIPTLVAGHPHATVPHWHRTHAGCRADAAAHGLPPGSCLKTHGGELPMPHVDLDSEGVER